MADLTFAYGPIGLKSPFMIFRARPGSAGQQLSVLVNVDAPTFLGYSLCSFPEVILSNLASIAVFTLNRENNQLRLFDTIRGTNVANLTYSLGIPPGRTLVALINPRPGGASTGGINLNEGIGAFIINASVTPVNSNVLYPFYSGVPYNIFYDNTVPGNVGFNSNQPVIAALSAFTSPTNAFGSSVDASQLYFVPTKLFGGCRGTSCSNLDNILNIYENYSCVVQPSLPQCAGFEILEPPVFTTKELAIAGVPFRVCAGSNTCGTDNCFGPCPKTNAECNFADSFTCEVNPDLVDEDNIQSPWWQSTWFILLMVFLGLLVIGGVITVFVVASSYGRRKREAAIAAQPVDPAIALAALQQYTNTI